MRVAVLGTGSMGAAMARRLAGAGFDVSVWNRTRERAEAVAADIGARVLSAPEDLDGAEVVLTSLADRDAVEDTFLKEHGLLDGPLAGVVVCEMSTVEPEVAQGLAPRVREAGGELLDTPVSGSVSTVEQGALTIMAGGDAAALDRARPVLEAMSKQVFHLGGSGTGAAMKLAVNAIVHGLNAALSEALVLAERAGISRETAYDVFESSAIGAPFVTYKRQAYADPAGAATAFRIALVQKDLELILALAEQLGSPMPQAAANLAVVREAAAQFGERDLSLLAEHLRGQAVAR